MTTQHARIQGRTNVWEIDYVHGLEKNSAREGVHILRVYGDITSPELLDAVERWRREQQLDGEIIFHFP